MVGTKVGGIKTRQTNYLRHGTDFYQKIGKKGGMRVGILKGFAVNPELAKVAGSIGGKRSKRGKAKKNKTI